MRVPLAILAAMIPAVILAACTPPPQDPAGRAADPVLITVFHADGAETPALGLYERWSLTGPATLYTAAELAALPHAAIETAYPPGSEPARWTGPRLSDLLAEAGAPGAGARLSAVDGYEVAVTADAIAAHEPILALARDGQALGIGGYGPAILIWPAGDDPDLAALIESQSPWAVFAVEAGAPPEAG